jgi:hypothetical protein
MVKMVENIGLPKLTSEQIEELCSLAEGAAKKHVLSKVALKELEALNISAEVEGEKPVTLQLRLTSH